MRTGSSTRSIPERMPRSRPIKITITIPPPLPPQRLAGHSPWYWRMLRPSSRCLQWPLNKKVLRLEARAKV